MGSTPEDGSSRISTSGTLGYVTFLRPTQLRTNDVRGMDFAFKRVGVNVIFNNRDDHPNNFAYRMSSRGQS